MANINSASYDQFSSFTSIESRVIFTEDAYKKLMELITTSNLRGCETGVFFLGKEVGGKDSNIIVIDSYTNDLTPSRGNVEGGAVEDNENSYKIRKAAAQNLGYDCMFHYHTHIKLSNKPLFYDVFSNQDLEAYRKCATDPYFQYYTKDDIENILGRNISSIEYNQILQDFVNGRGQSEFFRQRVPYYKKLSYFGMLATPNTTPKISDKTSNYQLSLVYADPSGKFYRFNHICYEMNGEIFEIGTYKRPRGTRLTNGIITPADVDIQAIGINPNTGITIQDGKVGEMINGKPSFGRRR